MELNLKLYKTKRMAFSVCKCGAVNSIRNSTCQECYAIHEYGYVCSNCCFEGLNGNEECGPCKEQAIYDAVPTMSDPPKLVGSTIKKTRLPDRYSTSRWTTATKPDPYFNNKYWKRQHEKGIRQLRAIKYA